MPVRRDTPGAGTYDKVISCEMIEAVGHEHLARYFDTINSMLKPGGRAAVQVCAWCRTHRVACPQTVLKDAILFVEVGGEVSVMWHRNSTLTLVGQYAEKPCT